MGFASVGSAAYCFWFGYSTEKQSPSPPRLELPNTNIPKIAHVAAGTPTPKRHPVSLIHGLAFSFASAGFLG